MAKYTDIQLENYEEYKAEGGLLSIDNWIAKGELSYEEELYSNYASLAIEEGGVPLGYEEWLEAGMPKTWKPPPTEPEEPPVEPEEPPVEPDTGAITMTADEILASGFFADYMSEYHPDVPKGAWTAFVTEYADYAGITISDAPPEPPEPPVEPPTPPPEGEGELLGFEQWLKDVKGMGLSEWDYLLKNLPDVAAKFQAEYDAYLAGEEPPVEPEEPPVEPEEPPVEPPEPPIEPGGEEEDFSTELAAAVEAYQRQIMELSARERAEALRLGARDVGHMERAVRNALLAQGRTAGEIEQLTAGGMEAGQRSMADLIKQINLQTQRQLAGAEQFGIGTMISGEQLEQRQREMMQQAGQFGQTLAEQMRQFNLAQQQQAGQFQQQFGLGQQGLAAQIAQWQKQLGQRQYEFEESQPGFWDYLVSAIPDIGVSFG